MGSNIEIEAKVLVSKDEYNQIIKNLHLDTYYKFKQTNYYIDSDEYDIKNLNPRPNPYADKLKKQITIRLNASTIDYFKQQAEETGISYQNLINMYLTDCAVHEKKLEYTIK